MNKIIFHVFVNMLFLAIMAGCENNYKDIQLINPLFWAEVQSLGIEGCMDYYQVPGCAWAVWQGDSVFKTGAHGIIAVGSERPVDLGSHFQIGSLSKSFTSLIAARCVESGFIEWDTPLFDVIPEWKQESRQEYHEIKLSDLLSHRTPLQPLNVHKTHVDKKTNSIVYEDMPNFKGTDIERRHQYCRYALSLEPVETEKLNYGNSGYSIAAAMLEAVTDKTWEELAVETANILNMETGFGRPNRLDDQQPWGHCHDENNLPEPVSPDDMRYYNDPIAAPAGNLHVNVPDFMKYLSVYMNGLDGRMGIVSSETVRYLLKGFPGYSLGWFNDNDGDEIYYHYGSEGTFYCNMMIFASLDAAIVIFTNAPGTKDTENFLNDVRNFLKHQYIYTSLEQKRMF